MEILYYEGIDIVRKGFRIRNGCTWTKTSIYISNNVIYMSYDTEGALHYQTWKTREIQNAAPKKEINNKNKQQL